MKLYQKGASNKLSEIQKRNFKLERDLQALIESKLYELTGLELVKSEFVIKDRRIDTLAFDREKQSFVIIEYKRDQSSSVVDQGFAYIQLMLQYGSELIVEFNENPIGSNTSLKRSDVDWTQSKVVFVAPSFNKNQVAATNFKDVAIELWEVKYFENDIFSFNIISKSDNAPSLRKATPKSQNEIKQRVEKTITLSDEQDNGESLPLTIAYDENYHLENTPSELQELYFDLKGRITSINEDISIKYLKLYIAFKLGSRNIVDIDLKKKTVKLFINLPLGILDDPKKLARDVSKIGHWGNGDYEISIDSNTDIDYLMFIIKQSIQYHSKQPST